MSIRRRPALAETPEPSPAVSKIQIPEGIVQLVLSRLLDAVRGPTGTVGTLTDATIRAYVDAVLNEQARTYTKAERDEVFRVVRSEVLGYGPLDPLLADESVTEIMVNGPADVYVERFGRIQATDVTFRDDAHIFQIIDRIVTPIGRRVDESSPMVDGRLPDGSRVNIVVPPIAVRGPSITIRKFPTSALGMRQLVQGGTLTSSMSNFLEAAVLARLNIIVSGGTGSGKTTTLNALSHFIPENHRIVTIEDAAELRLQQPHVVTLEARPANIEGRGEITIRQMVINALRMRPDRIIVGEVRGGEALDMLQAMNTGHDGSLTTAHANSPRDLLSRLETMVLMSGAELPVRAVRDQIQSAIDLIVHQSRLRDGSRRITEISELTGMEGDIIVLQDIFHYRQDTLAPDGTVLGQFEPTGVIPHCLDRMAQEGQFVPTRMFQAARP